MKNNIDVFLYQNTKENANLRACETLPKLLLRYSGKQVLLTDGDCATMMQLGYRNKHFGVYTDLRKQEAKTKIVNSDTLEFRGMLARVW